MSVFVESNKITLDLTLKIWSTKNQNEPSEAFAKKYIEEAIAFSKHRNVQSKDIADA
jgi:sulfite reductase (ferredoxin)